jgi:glutaredoxin 3
VNPANMSAAKTKAQAIIDENPVGMYFHCPLLCTLANRRYTAVFSKSYCPYCKATKQTLSDLGAKFYTIELDQVGMLFTFPRCAGIVANEVQ